MQHGDINTEKPAKWAIQVTDHITHEADREHSDDTHGQFYSVRLCLEKKDAKKGEKTQALKKRPPEIQF